MAKFYNKEWILNKMEDFYGDWFMKTQSPKMTNNLYPYNILFSPICINGCEINNRIVMGPMANRNMTNENGGPSKKMVSFFEERARGNVGLIVTGMIPTGFGVDPTLWSRGELFGFPRIDKTNICDWRELTEKVHCYGTKIFAELSMGLGRVGNYDYLIKRLKLPVSASSNPNFYSSIIPSRQLTKHQMKSLIKRTVQACANAKACFFDGVLLQGNEGLLLEQLSNSAYNRRKVDRYSDPMQFGIDLVKQIRKQSGEDFPIIYRIDMSLALNATYGSDIVKIKELKKFKNERTIDQTLEYMQELVLAGVDGFDIGLGSVENWWLAHPPESMPSECFVDFSQIVKKHFEQNNILTNAGKDVVVVAVGKLGYPDVAEQILRDNKADMIMLARPLLADSYWVKKTYGGNIKDIVPCIGCHACLKTVTEGGHLQCAVNAMAGEEDEEELKFAKKIKRVAVVGAGPAGIVASKVLIQRGHNVDLYEKEINVGGMLRFASLTQFKYELKNYLSYLSECVKELNKKDNFRLKLKTVASIELLKQQNYDTIIFATGSQQEPIDIDGAVLPHVYTIKEFLENPKTFENIKRVAIIGGGECGCELAYMLAYEKNIIVTILEQKPYLMRNSCLANRGHILHYLKKIGVKVYNCCKINKIEEGFVNVLANIHKSVPNPYNTWQPILSGSQSKLFNKTIKEKYKAVVIDADVVIIAYGQRSNNDLYKQACQQRVAPEIYCIGDSLKCGKVFGAVKSAYNLAKNI